MHVVVSDALPDDASIGGILALQVRKLSVQRINTPVIFDNLKNAVSGGLYDPCMGPLDQKDT